MLAALRFALASVVLVPLALWQICRQGSFFWRDLPMLIFLGQIGISTYFWLQFTGVALTSAGISAILVVGLMPAATAVASHIYLGEKLTAAKVLGLVLGATGVVVISLQRDIRISAESGFLLGVLCLVANSLTFAIYSILVRRLRTRHSSLAITGNVTGWGALGLLVMATFDGSWGTIGDLSSEQWGAVAFLVMACSVMGYFAYNSALARLEASKATTWLYLEPVVAVVLGWMVLGEVVTLPTITGGILIAGSILMVQRT